MSGLSYQKKLNVILVDDEKIANQRLKTMLSIYPFINIIGEATDGYDAVKIINERNPDLVFLDIQMPGMTGFDVLAEIEHRPLIVFVTAFDEYAVKAFEENSLDYLLKPVSADRLEVTIKRVQDREGQQPSILSVLKKLINTGELKGNINTIPVRTADRITLIAVTDIFFFEAGDKYVYLHTENDKKLIDLSLGYLENRLPAEFVRIHRTFIVNKFKIAEMRKFYKGTYMITMRNLTSSQIRTGYSYQLEIKNRLLTP